MVYEYEGNHSLMKIICNYTDKPKNIRYGQYVFNRCYDISSRVANQLRSTEHDCFHNNNRIKEFVIYFTEIYTKSVISGTCMRCKDDNKYIEFMGTYEDVPLMICPLCALEIKEYSDEVCEGLIE